MPKRTIGRIGRARGPGQFEVSNPRNADLRAKAAEHRREEDRKDSEMRRWRVKLSVAVEVGVILSVAVCVCVAGIYLIIFAV